MSNIFHLLESLCTENFLSGNERCNTKNETPEFFKQFGAFSDEIGNLWIKIKSEYPKAKNILIEAHLDAIGLCVKDITEKGFLSVSPCGGFDAEILPGTEFFIHSDKKYKAIAASVPPHLMKKAAAKEKITVKDIYLDCGFSSAEEAKSHVKSGDPISFAAPVQKLLGGRICSPSLDNKAAVIALLLAATKVKSPHNLHFMFSLGEETTSRGVKTASFTNRFDLALVVDAGFAYAKGLNEDQCIFMGKGPSLSSADTLSRKAFLWIESVAEKLQFPLQIVVEPGGTGTSATALQLREHGIPCALISIPLKYMHTPSEVVCVSDIEKTADFLCLLLEQDQIPFGEVTIVE